jgi:hypothetical protein
LKNDHRQQSATLLAGLGSYDFACQHRFNLAFIYSGLNGARSFFHRACDRCAWTHSSNLAVCERVAKRSERPQRWPRLRVRLAV